MKSIYTLTLSPTIDKSCNVDRVIAEHKLRCTTPKHEPGGGGINVSRAIKKLGGESVALYPKGGATGELLHMLLDQEGISQHTVESKSWNRENFIVVEDSTNRQFRFGMPGPELQTSEWEQFLKDISSHEIDYMVASGSTPPGVPDEFYSRLAHIIKKKGAKLVLDTSGDALKEAADEGIYLLKPNLKELGELVGQELSDIRQQEEAAMNVVQTQKIELLVVSLGPAGAMMASKDGIVHVPAPPVNKKSTVGAGDSMVAGMVLSLSRDLSLAESLKYGIACGTAATMNAGTELCKKEDVENLYQWLMTPKVN
jgi:6-phosphofructokinase 2